MRAAARHARTTLLAALVGVAACSSDLDATSDAGTTGTGETSAGTTGTTSTSTGTAETSDTAPDTSDTGAETTGEPSDAFLQEAYVKASNTDNNYIFGYAVAVSGDTLVVGSSGEASAATGIDGDQTDDTKLSSGAVYVFVRSGTTWTQQAYLKASNTDAEDGFGNAVTISGDTLVVGAALEDSGATGIDGDQTNTATDSGAAYVFVRSGTTWTQQAYLKASNTDADDYFGQAVAVSGDTLVVGARGEASAATGVDGDQNDNTGASGAAYVFVRSGTTWTHQSYLKASNTDGNDKFGYAVAVSGDTLAVGAYGEASDATGIDGNQTDNTAGASGAVYVFVRSGATWTQQAYVKASNTDVSDAFGYALAVSGDTLIVGAVGEASNATGVDADQTDDAAKGSGAAYVFVRSGTTWTQQAYLKASNTRAGYSFGNAVALSDDVLLIGSSSEASSATGIDGNQADGTQPRSGAAYVFVRGGTTWTQEAYLKASNTDADDYFGGAVAVSGDTLVVGTASEDSAATGIDGDQADDTATESGAAYVFRCDAALCP